MTSPARGRTGLLVVACVLLLPGPRAVAAELRRPFGEGSHALRVILHRADLKPIKSDQQLREEIDAHPERVLIISLGKQDWLRVAAIDLGAFHERGGAFLGASDLKTDEWEPFYGWTVEGTRYGFQGEIERYRDSPACPFVHSLRNKECPVFLGLKRVATNLPSRLVRAVKEPALPLVAKVSVWDFAAGGPVDNGRALLLADHSIFINEMMLPTDNDNFDFARSAVDWLTDYGQRDRVFFMNDGALVTDFNVPVKELPPPPLPSLTELMAMAERTAYGLQEEGFFQRQMNEANQRLGRIVPRTGLLRGLTLGLTAALAFLGLARLVRARYPDEPQAPRLSAALANAPPFGAVADERLRAVREGGNFWEAAQGVARQFFDAALRDGPGEACPLVGGSAERHRLRAWQRQVRRLWQLARAAKPWRVSPREFERLVGEVAALKAALADGSLTLTAASGGRQPPEKRAGDRTFSQGADAPRSPG